MKVLHTIVLLVILSFSLVAAEVSMDYFTTKADGNNVNVEWRCSAEKAVLRYEIERSSDGQNFRTVTAMEVRGAYQVYRYTDSDVLMKDGDAQKRISANSYYYRIKIVGTDNSVSYSSVSSVVHNISSVRRTWGMIKEMFK